MLMILVLAANACSVAWDPVGVLPERIRPKLESAQMVSPCRVASLPAAVRGFLTQRLGNKQLGMADPGQQWDSSCVRPMEGGLPGRQLIAAAKAGRNWVVHYREGGFAVFERAVVIELDGETIREVWHGSCAGGADRRKCSDSTE
jgi:hypothetical protein